MPLLKPAELPVLTYYDIPDLGRVPRVTAVLSCLAKPGLERWRGAVGNDEADRIGREARDFGTRLHAVLERFNRQQPLGDVGDLEPWVRRYIGWVDENVRRVLEAERTVVSRAHGFAGTCDVVFEMNDGSLAVADFKSSTAGPWRPDSSGAAQLAAYRLALAEASVICTRRLVLQFPSAAPGELLVHEFTRHKADTLAFVHLLEVFKWQQEWRP